MFSAMKSKWYLFIRLTKYVNYVKTDKCLWKKLTCNKKICQILDIFTRVKCDYSTFYLDNTIRAINFDCARAFCKAAMLNTFANLLLQKYLDTPDFISYIFRAEFDCHVLMKSLYIEFSKYACPIYFEMK